MDIRWAFHNLTLFLMDFGISAGTVAPVHLEVERREGTCQLLSGEFVDGHYYHIGVYNGSDSFSYNYECRFEVLAFCLEYGV